MTNSRKQTSKQEINEVFQKMYGPIFKEINDINVRIAIVNEQKKLADEKWKEWKKLRKLKKLKKKMGKEQELESTSEWIKFPEEEKVIPKAPLSFANMEKKKLNAFFQDHKRHLPAIPENKKLTMRYTSR